MSCGGPERGNCRVPSNEWKPCQERGLSLFVDLELDGPLRVLLDDCRSIPDRTSRPKVLDSQLDEIASAELAVDGKIEECQLSVGSVHFEPNADRPYVL
jgi:hypothetical protein